MSIGKVGRSLAALTLICLTFAGCTADPAPPPSPTPIPPASQTPTESPQQRQERLDYEAAEKAYRTFRAEIGRLAARGGAKTATPEMTQTAGGPYLKEYVDFFVALKSVGLHKEGSERIIYVKRSGYTPKSLILDICEDSRRVVTYDEKGKVFGKGEVRTARLEVRKVANMWRVWSGDGKKVNQCD